MHWLTWILLDPTVSGPRSLGWVRWCGLRWQERTDGSALDGADHHALREVALQEGVEHQDRNDGDHEDRHLQRQLGRQHLGGDLVAPDGGLVDDVRAQH